MSLSSSFPLVLLDSLSSFILDFFALSHSLGLLFVPLYSLYSIPLCPSFLFILRSSLSFLTVCPSFLFVLFPTCPPMLLYAFVLRTDIDGTKRWESHAGTVALDETAVSRSFWRSIGLVVSRSGVQSVWWSIGLTVGQSVERSVRLVVSRQVQRSDYRSIRRWSA